MSISKRIKKRFKKRKRRYELTKKYFCDFILIYLLGFFFGRGKKKKEKKKKSMEQEDDDESHSIGAPYDFVHRGHVDQEFNWSGDPEQVFTLEEKLGEG